MPLFNQLCILQLPVKRDQNFPCVKTNGRNFIDPNLVKTMDAAYTSQIIWNKTLQ